MLLASSFIIFAPSLLNDVVNPPEKSFEISKVANFDKSLEYVMGRVEISGAGEDLYGDPMKFRLFVNVKEGDSVRSIIESTGVGYEQDGRYLRVLRVKFGSLAEQNELDPLGNFVINSILVPQPQPDKKLMYFPAVMLFGFVLLSQMFRRRKERAVEKFTKWRE
jgi:hypothetical protein